MTHDTTYLISCTLHFLENACPRPPKDLYRIQHACQSIVSKLGIHVKSAPGFTNSSRRRRSTPFHPSEVRPLTYGSVRDDSMLIDGDICFVYARVLCTIVGSSDHPKLIENISVLRPSF